MATDVGETFIGLSVIGSRRLRVICWPNPSVENTVQARNLWRTFALTKWIKRDHRNYKQFRIITHICEGWHQYTTIWYYRFPSRSLHMYVCIVKVKAQSLVDWYMNESHMWSKPSKVFLWQRWPLPAQTQRGQNVWIIVGSWLLQNLH